MDERMVALAESASVGMDPHTSLEPVDRDHFSRSRLNMVCFASFCLLPLRTAAKPRSVSVAITRRMSTQVPVSTPRLSASLIVINAQNEVLLVQRNPKSSAFASMHVSFHFNVRIDQLQIG